MAGTEPACSVAKKTATDPSGVDSDKGADSAHCAFSSGARIIESGVGLEEKKHNKTKPPDTMAEATDPSGIVVEEVGIEMGDRGRSCEEHSVCGEVVEEDTLLRLRRVQIEVDGHKEMTIACIWVTEVIDRCCVGFLKRNMLKHAWRFNGALTQVTKVFSVDPCHCDLEERRMHYHNHGCALATIVSNWDAECTSAETLAGVDGKTKM
jgi:hypothetical protein